MAEGNRQAFEQAALRTAAEEARRKEEARVKAAADAAAAVAAAAAAERARQLVRIWCVCMSELIAERTLVVFANHKQPGRRGLIGSPTLAWSSIH